MSIIEKQNREEAHSILYTLPMMTYNPVEFYSHSIVPVGLGVIS